VDKIKYKPKRKAITVHGFRATFRTWGANQNYDDKALEACLGHIEGNEYQRSDRLKTRRDIMEKWSQYVEECKA